MISSIRTSALILTFLALAPGAGAAAEPLAYTFGTESTVSYRVTHPIHGATGISHRLKGTVSVVTGQRPELVLPVRLSVPLASFDSGNRNRDRNMLTVMSAARHPEAVLTLERITWQSRKGAGVETSAEGTGHGVLSLKGVSRPVTVPLNGQLRGDRLWVVSRFAVMLSDYDIERPSLLLRPIDDRVELAIEGVARR